MLNWIKGIAGLVWNTGMSGTKNWGVLSFFVGTLLAVGFLVATASTEARIGYANLWYGVAGLTMMAVWVKIKLKLEGVNFADVYEQAKAGNMAVVVLYLGWLFAGAYIIGRAITGLG